MRKLILGIVLSALVPGLGFAQTAKDSWDNLSQLRLGQKIEVMDTDLKSIKGGFANLADGAISLRIGKDEITLKRPDVLRVGARRSRSRKAKIGAAIGLGIGMALLPIGWKAGEEAGENALWLIPVGLGVGWGIGVALPASYRPMYTAAPAFSAPAGDGEATLEVPNKNPVLNSGPTSSQPVNVVPYSRPS